jgi:hypothetical protein
MNVTALQKLLVVLAVGLTAALGWLTDWGQNFAETDLKLQAPATKPDGASVLPDFKLSSDSSAYAQIAERPLLNPTRRPAPTQAAVAVAPEPPKPQIRRGLYQLIGVVDAGYVRVAHVREISTNRVRSVKVGDSLQEMRVNEISPQKLTLGFQGEIDVVALPGFTPSGRVPQPPQIAAPQPPQVAVPQAPQIAAPSAQTAPAEPTMQRASAAAPQPRSPNDPPLGAPPVTTAQATSTQTTPTDPDLNFRQRERFYGRRQ